MKKGGNKYITHDGSFISKNVQPLLALNYILQLLNSDAWLVSSIAHISQKYICPKVSRLASTATTYRQNWAPYIWNQNKFKAYRRHCTFESITLNVIVSSMKS